MGTLPPIVALEIGTTKVCALVGEIREDGRLAVTGKGVDASLGVRKSEIMHFENALSCVRRALTGAEESADVSIGGVHLVVSGSQIACEVHRGTTHVLNEYGEITEEEIRSAGDAARQANLPPERTLLHSVIQRYFIDGLHGVTDPRGMEGRELAVDMLILHAASTPLNNTIKAATEAQVDVIDTAFGGLCASLAVLTPEQKAAGVAVVDLGGGTTDTLIYADHAMASARSFAIGGDHVTNDISRGLHIPYTQAERLKVQSGDATLRTEARHQTIALAPEGGFAGRTVQMSDLQLIINARMEELFRILCAEWEREGLLHGLGAGIVFTGGGAKMKGVIDLAKRVFNVPCSVGVARGYSGPEGVMRDPEFAAPLGMLRYAAMSAEQAAGAGGGGMLDRLRGIMGLR